MTLTCYDSNTSVQREAKSTTMSKVPNQRTIEAYDLTGLDKILYPNNVSFRREWMP